MRNEDSQNINITDARTERKGWAIFFDILLVLYFITIISSAIKLFRSEPDYIIIIVNLLLPLPFLILIHGYTNYKRYFNKLSWKILISLSLPLNLYYLSPLLSAKGITHITSDVEILSYFVIKAMIKLPISFFEYYCAYKYIFKSEDIWGNTSNQPFK